MTSSNLLYDSESEGEEEKFYLWSYDEILEVLGEFYGITKRVKRLCNKIKPYLI